MNRITIQATAVTEAEGLKYENVIRDAIGATRPRDERWVVNMRAAAEGSVLIFEFNRESELPRSFTFQPQDHSEGQLSRIARQFLISEWADGARRLM